MTAVTPGAWAVIKYDTPQIFVAESADVISRLIALKVVAAADPAEFEPHQLERVRSYLLHENWSAALLMWIEATGIEIDVYDEFVPIWTETRLDRELASLEIRTSRLFNES